MGTALDQGTGTRAVGETGHAQGSGGTEGGRWGSDRAAVLVQGAATSGVQDLDSGTAHN